MNAKAPVAKTAKYLRECKEEFDKITWPTRSETIKYSIMTICIALGVALFFAASDWLLTRGLEQLIQLSS